MPGWIVRKRQVDLEQVHILGEHLVRKMRPHTEPGGRLAPHQSEAAAASVVSEGLGGRRLVQVRGQGL